MKKITALLLVLLLSAALPLSAMALVDQSESFYVCDDAGVLGDRLEQKIIDANGALEQNCHGAQIVVVSVAYMDGYYADEYAYSLMNSWGIGDKDANNGMLLLFATKENRGWLAVGDGIYGSFDEDMASMYLDSYFWDDYDDGDYNSAVENLFDALVEWYGYHYDTDVTSAGSDASYSDASGYYDGDYDDESDSSLWDPSHGFLYNISIIVTVYAVLFSPLILFSLIRTRIRWGRWGLWPFYLFRPWWREARRGVPYMTSRSSSRSGGYSGHSYSSSHSYSSHGSYSSHSSSGGFSSHSSSSSHSSGSGHGGGGHSGGGAGRR